jgi:hypothetical protein
VLRAHTFEWCEYFSEGRDEDEFYIQPERTSSKQDENVEKVRTLRNERCLAVRVTAEELNAEMQQLILTENPLMKKVRANMVPKNLFCDQLFRRRKFQLIFVVNLR